MRDDFLAVSSLVQYLDLIEKLGSRGHCHHERPRRHRSRRHEDPGGRRRRPRPGARQAPRRRRRRAARRTSPRRSPTPSRGRAATGTSSDQLIGVGVGSPSKVRARRESSSRRATSRTGTPPTRSARPWSTSSARRSVWATTSTSPSPGSSNWAPEAVRLDARRLVGRRRRRRRHPRRPAVGRARHGGRDRPHGGQDQRAPVPVRASRLHGGLRGARGDGGRARELVGEGRQDEAVRDHGGARPRPPDQRRVGARPARGRQAREPSCSTRRWAPSAPASPRPATSRRRGRDRGRRSGRAVRLRYAGRILDAMLPHLFVDNDPPAVQVAALGDLGGAIGAALLVPGGDPAGRRAARPREADIEEVGGPPGPKAQPLPSCCRATARRGCVPTRPRTDPLDAVGPSAAAPAQQARRPTRRRTVSV